VLFRSGECRHAGILTYFKDRDRIESCGHCDVCDPDSARRVPHIYAPPPKSITRKGKTGKKKPRSEGIAGPLSTEESERMRLLKAWRLDYARAQDMPAFIIFSNRTLEDLARKAPRTLTELEGIYGLGAQRIETFGKELLEVLKGMV
jgi:ATP-dependent DNA helicase RecQ